MPKIAQTSSKPDKNIKNKRDTVFKTSALNIIIPNLGWCHTLSLNSHEKRKVFQDPITQKHARLLQIGSSSLITL